MRFLLLCPVALLLLAAPVPTESGIVQSKPVGPPPNNSTKKSDNVQVIPARSPPNNSTTTGSARSQEPVNKSPSPSKPTPTSSPKAEFVSESTELPGKRSPVLDQRGPKGVRLLKRKLARAEAELKSLNEENRMLEGSFSTMHFNMNKLVTTRLAFARDLQSTRRKLRAALAKLRSRRAQRRLCQLSTRQFFKLIAEETNKQLEERRLELKSAFGMKYQHLLNEVRLKLRRELLLFSLPRKSRGKFITFRSLNRT